MKQLYRIEEIHFSGIGALSFLFAFFMITAHPPSCISLLHCKIVMGVSFKVGPSDTNLPKECNYSSYLLWGEMLNVKHVLKSGKEVE